jgi:hypothetical protein
MHPRRPGGAAVTQEQLSGELGRILGLLMHHEGSLERAIEQVESEIADWRGAITPEKPE